MERGKKSGLPPLPNKLEPCGEIVFTTLKKLGVDFDDEKKCDFKGKKRGNILKIVKILKEINEKMDKNQERLELIEKRITKKLEEDTENLLHHICIVQDQIIELNEEESESESENEN